MDFAPTNQLQELPGRVVRQKRKPRHSTKLTSQGLESKECEPLPDGNIEQKTQVRCNCGKCALCRDNAKWEKVFNEKFADPDYYKSASTRNGSPLNRLL